MALGGPLLSISIIYFVISLLTIIIIIVNIIIIIIIMLTVWAFFHFCEKRYIFKIRIEDRSKKICPIIVFSIT